MPRCSRPATIRLRQEVRPPASGRHGTTIYATLVRKIEWDGPANPNAKIDEHTVIVKDFGQIFFGESSHRIERRAGSR